MHKSKSILLLQSSIWICNVWKLGGIKRIKVEVNMYSARQTLPRLIPL